MRGVENQGKILLATSSMMIIPPGLWILFAQHDLGNSGFSSEQKDFFNKP